MIRQITLAVALAVGLDACASQATQATVDNSVAGTAVALTAAERLALIYTSLPRCTTTGATSVCSDPATVAKIKVLDNQAYNAVKAAESDSSLVAGALSAVVALKSIIPSL